MPAPPSLMGICYPKYNMMKSSAVSYKLHPVMKKRKPLFRIRLDRGSGGKILKPLPPIFSCYTALRCNTSCGALRRHQNVIAQSGATSSISKFTQPIK